MLSIFKNLFKSNSVDLSQLIKEGAVVIDVRSKAEFSSGHVKGSVNIPLENIGSNSDKLKKHNHIIVCCRSGNRSGMAQRTLQAKGFKNVTNGGSWQNVNKHIK
ncbi:MAG: rhodanese-like domain-containing protein [Bacteroidota bacterium]|nr:rhodanese-like domain-containing protein [Bacteroidota bacterium]MDP3145839.1 rhodanese-like domain-containing protein [Bacteroidota bacterium]MDP3558473.1 rhodanese-like domain-containing protein [Bacteroidota bacterium]